MGHDTKIWARDAELVETMNTTRTNPKYLKGHDLPPKLVATSVMKEVFDECDIILTVIPSQSIETCLEPAIEYLRPEHIICSCSKGIMHGTLETVDEMLTRLLPGTKLAYLSGPSFAKDTAMGLPTCVSISSRDVNVARTIQHAISTSNFRCYRTDDVIGVELGGALKNVLAIACGISDGLEYGLNARAALITRGLAEIAKIASAKGANPLTMSGLAGMGDLILTCTGDLSRNRTFGLRLGRGETKDEILKSMHPVVVEGVATSESAHMLAQKLGIDCPIIGGIYSIVHEDMSPKELMYNLMTRPLTDEIDSETLKAAVCVGGSALFSRTSFTATRNGNH